MPTRIATHLNEGAPEQALPGVCDALSETLGEAPGLVLAFATSKHPLGSVTGPLSQRFPGATVLGASTAGEFTETGDAKNACAFFALAGDYKLFSGMGRGLAADPNRAITEALREVPREVAGYPHCTGVLLLDPLAGNGEEATLLTATALGPRVKLAGGAAGDDLAMKETFVAHGSSAASDALVISLIFSKQPLAVGVDHGHKPLSRSLQVTSAAAGKVNTVNGRPAWDVWREETEAYAATLGLDVRTLSPAEEGAYLLRFEAGLSAGAETKVRAPLSRNADGSINFACGMPEGTHFCITESNAERQIESARRAATKASRQLGARGSAGAVIFDCICRNLILGDAFGDAVRGMSQALGDVPIAGFETYGEIALDAGDFSGFHNTTSVVLAFPKD